MCSMLGKEKFKEMVLNTFGDDVSSERLDMLYKNYLFTELGRNQIYGVTGGTNLEFTKLENECTCDGYGITDLNKNINI